MLGNYLIWIIYNKQITFLELFQFVTRRSIYSLSKAFRVSVELKRFKIISFRSPLLIFQKNNPNWILIFYRDSYVQSFLGSFSLASLRMRFSIRCFQLCSFFFHKKSKFCKYCFSTLLSNGLRLVKGCARAERWQRRKSGTWRRPTQKQCEL